MGRVHCLIGAMALGVVLSAAEYSTATMLVYPSGASDAVVYHHWEPGYSEGIVDETSLNLTAYWSATGVDLGWDIPVLEFPLAGVSADSATLNFYVSSAGQLSMLARYAGGDDDGIINASVDWLNLPTTTVGTFNGSETGWYSFDVTSQLQDVLSSGDDWMVFLIRPGVSGAGTTIAASENTQYAPYLSIVPEPSAFILLGLGAFGLLAYARRRRAA